MVWKGCSVSHDFVPCGPSNVELPSLVQSMAKVSFPASIVCILFRTSALSPMSNGADDSDFMVAMLHLVALFTQLLLLLLLRTDHEEIENYNDEDNPNP